MATALTPELAATIRGARLVGTPLRACVKAAGVPWQTAMDWLRKGRAYNAAAPTERNPKHGALGSFAALLLPGWLGFGREWGAVGLTLAASVAGWMEFVLLRDGLAARVGGGGVPWGLQARLFGSALPAGAFGFATKLALGPELHPVLRGVAVVAVFGVVYLGLALALGVPEARGVAERVRSRLGRRSG